MGADSAENPNHKLELKIAIYKLSIPNAHKAIGR
jgi:hypothetical protein